jgi:hypothetical protein
MPRFCVFVISITAVAIQSASAPSVVAHFSGNSGNTDQWAPNTNPPQTVDPAGGAVLYNGIQLPASWPPLDTPTQQYRVPPYLVNRPAVVPIDVGRQLFVDDFLIDSTDLTRVQHQPVLYSGNPILAPNSQGLDPDGLAMVYSDGVWYDPADHLFKMWYDGGYGNHICYAVSSDGLSWTKPRLPDAVVPNTNIVLQLGGGRDSTTVWMDLRDDPSRKFKLFSYYPDNNVGYVGIYFSPDGIHWGPRQSNSPLSLWDRTTVYYNPFRGVWVNSARNSAAYLPPTAVLAGANVRSRHYSESRDLQNWNPPDPTNSFEVSRDDRDPPYPGSTRSPDLYNLDATPYESLMVGLFSWYYAPDGPDLAELSVGFSRDGFHWSRPTRGAGPANAFIAASNQPNTWNGYNTQSAGGGFLVVGDQLYIYFSGRNNRHSLDHDASTMRYTGLAMLRRDGFYSMDAGPGPGTMTTHPVRFSGNHLFVNVADPQGQLQVEVLDVNGNVIPQFSKNNSAVISADSTAREVRWTGGSLGSLAGQPVRFRFYLTNGELYSFWATPAATGASNGYVAGGGPGFTSNIDSGSGGQAAGNRAAAHAGIFRGGFFWLLDADGNLQFNAPPDQAFAFGGIAGDIPITGDWNGSGTSKVGVYRSSTGQFILDMDGDGQLTAADKVFSLGIGMQSADLPVVGDWNGDGRSKVGIFRQGFQWILDTNGNGAFDSADQSFAFGGVPGDVPVVGDWNGAGISKPGVFRAGFLWVLDSNGDHTPSLVFPFGGLAGDVPIVGDWNGDGRSKVGIFRAGFLWVLDTNGNQSYVPGVSQVFAFGGIAGDKPVVGKW